jgi:hypothetical protein
MRFFHVFLGLCLIGLVPACSDVPKPDDGELMEHLKSLDIASLSDDTQSFFADAKIVDIKHNSGEPVALATVSIPQENDNDRTIVLVLRNTDQGWEVYDKDLTDPRSSTYMLLKRK